jgi:hypothetical protein
MNNIQHWLAKSRENKSKQNSIFIFSIVLLTGLIGCTTPEKAMISRDIEIRQARKDLLAGENEAMAQLVQKSKAKADETGEFVDFVDYYYIKSASTRLLYQTILQRLSVGKVGEARPLLAEALKISPDHTGLLKIAGQIDEAGQPPYLLDGFAPTSRTAQTINRMFDRRMLYSRGWRFQSSRPLDDFSEDEITPFRQYFQALTSPVELSSWPPSITGVGASFLPEQDLRDRVRIEVDNGLPSQIGDSWADASQTRTESARLTMHHFLKYLQSVEGLPVLIHQSAWSAINEFSLDGYVEREVYPQELLTAITRNSNVNIIVGPFGLAIFSGADVPSDLDHGRSMFSIKPEYQAVSSLANGLRAMGFGQNIVGMDDPSSTLYFKGRLGEYLRAIEYVASVDSAPAEVLLNVEIVEIEQSLLHAIGVRIPQKIDINLADPVYRRYSFTNAFGQAINKVKNDGVIVNHNTTGSVGLTNLFEQSTKDVLRAVVRDPAFSLSAREKNYQLTIIERPSIRLRSGQEGRIDVGSRIPVITATATSSGFVSEQVTYVNAGIAIVADARVTQDEKLRMNMKITTSNLVKLVASPSGSSAPQLSSREISTNLTIRDGETALIGGISSFKHAGDRDGMPGLAKSKFTTPFGGQASTDQVRNELLMFVTPEIVSASHIASRNLNGISGGGASPSFNASSSSSQPNAMRSPSR